MKRNVVAEAAVIRDAIKRRFPAIDFLVRAISQRDLIQVRWDGTISYAAMRALLATISNPRSAWTVARGCDAEEAV